MRGRPFGMCYSLNEAALSRATGRQPSRNLRAEFEQLRGKANRDINFKVKSGHIKS